MLVLSYLWAELFLVNYMLTPKPSPLKSDQIEFLAQKDAQNSEIYEKTFFRYLQFLVFGIWSILYSKYL